MKDKYKYKDNKYISYENKYVIQNINGNNTYIRAESKQYNILCDYIKKCYNYDTAICTSGMNAIYITLICIIQQNIKKKINIICTSEIYYDTHLLLDNLKQIYNINIKVINIHKQYQQLTSYAKEIKNKNNYCNIIFMESCSNPNGYKVNYKALINFKNKIKNTKIIIDNTWLTHKLENPFIVSDDYVDYVVISLTKHYSGGNAIAGAIISKNNIKIINTYIKISGIYVAPNICNIIINNMKLMNERIINTSKKTKKIIDILKTKKNIIIKHPYIHYKCYNKILPTTFTIKIIKNKNIKNKNIKNKIIKKIKKTDIELKTSFGSKKTRIDPWIYKYKKNLYIRISIGYQYENIKQLINSILYIINY